jgi:D-inositol-3-phosphate glycosyltransferase
VPGAVVENNVRVWRGAPSGGPKGTTGALRARLSHAVAGTLVRRWLPRADAVIAETDALRRALVGHVGVPEARVAVVGLGVDHELFRPGDRAEARARLGLDPEARILLYFGVLDATHDLTAVLAAARSGAAEVHVVGDGERRAEYEQLARGAPVHFHGRVPHAEVPTYIAAADLCLAPYARAAFTDGEIDYFTLKIPEAMACGRPVASVPAEQTRALIEHGESGFLVENTPAAWTALLGALPPRERLDEMGARARERASAITWRTSAEGYLAVCERVVLGPRA